MIGPRKQQTAMDAPSNSRNTRRYPTLIPGGRASSSSTSTTMTPPVTLPILRLSAAPQPSSRPTPMPRSHIPKTASELQLCEDMEAAEWRDLCMFYRVVNGIRERQHVNAAVDNSLLPARRSMQQMTAANESIENIIKTRRRNDGTSNGTLLNSSAQMMDVTVTPTDSPHQHVLVRQQQQQQQQGFLPSHNNNDAMMEDEKTNDWSISGYLSDDNDDNDELYQQQLPQPQYPLLLPQRQQQQRQQPAAVVVHHGWPSPMYAPPRLITAAASSTTSFAIVKEDEPEVDINDDSIFSLDL